MLSIGKPTAFFGDFLDADWVSDLLALVLEVWPQVEVSGIPEAKRFEPRISALLCLRLGEVLETAMSPLPFSAFSEIKYFDPITGVELARTDLEFHPRGFRIAHRKAYLVFEAKCLRIVKNTNMRSNNGEYVADMIGFVNDGKKVKPAFCAMLGYVMDGDVLKAFNALQRTIKSKRGELHLTNTDGIAAYPPLAHPPHGATEHASVESNNNRLSMHHLLLAVQQ